MSSPSTIDFDVLLAPIAEDEPAGEDLRGDASPESAYYQLKDARKAARDKERGHATDGDDASSIPDRSDWRPVLAQCTEVLEKRSKDLEIVAWFIEALVRLHGFAGLRDGFKLAQGVVEQYWESAYPREEDLEDRVAPLTGLNGQDAEGTLIVPIRSVFITDPQSSDPYASWHYQQAVAVQQLSDPEVREKRVAAGAATLGVIDKASMETGDDFLQNQYKDLEECQLAFEELTKKLDELCGDAAAPPSSNIKKELAECMDAVKYVGKRVMVEAVVVTDEPGPVGAATGGGLGGATSSREEAFQQLQQLADFFRRTEPHSPLSYAIERVVRWGRMPLPELLGEMITEEAAREKVYWLAGISKPDAGQTGPDE